MRCWLVAACGVVLLIATAAAQEVRPDRFRFERPIETAGAGPRRLAVDVPLLTGADASLADLRLFDRYGAAVPYILLRPRAGVRQWIEGDVLPVALTDKTSGFEADFQLPQPLDSLRVSGLPPPFLKRFVLEGSGDREHWTMLAAEGTFFDLPDEGLRQIDWDFPGGTYRYLRVTWDDRNSGRVPRPSTVQARKASGTVAPPPLTARVAAERRSSEPGRSRYRVKLPAPRLPVAAIDVIVEGGVHVFRPAVIRESRLSGMRVQPAELGRARLMQVARDGAVAGAMRIPIQPPSEPEVELVVEDGNNSPLDVTGVLLVFAELPWIYFEAPGGPVTAQYGNPGVGAPTYDLEAVRERVHIESVNDATWGTPRRLRDSTDAVPAAVPLPDGGPTLDPNLFSVRRPIPAGPPGLVALRLDADALAHSRGVDAEFADVRLIDASNRQVPYIIERRDEPVALAASLERREPADAQPPQVPGRNVSFYLVRLPYADLPSAQLVLETPARVFQRRVELSVERPPDRSHRASWREPLAVTTWSHVDTDEAASALFLPLPRVDAQEIWLSIDEGDNNALPVTGARLLLPSYRLRFYRPAGAALRLAYGRSDLSAPRYDLALLGSQVLGVEAQELAAAPAASEGAGAQAEFISRRTFWIFLSSAVLVLLGLIVRLAKKEEGAAPRL